MMPPASRLLATNHSGWRAFVTRAAYPRRLQRRPQPTSAAKAKDPRLPAGRRNICFFLLIKTNSALIGRNHLNLTW